MRRKRFERLRRLHGVEQGDDARRMHDYDRAVSAYESYLAAVPDDALVHLQLGRTLDAMGRVRDAVESTQRSLALNPRRIAAWYFLSDLLFVLGQDERAKTASETAARLSKNTHLFLSDHPREPFGRMIAIEAYANWVRSLPVPPAGYNADNVLIVVDAAAGRLEWLAATVRSVAEWSSSRLLLVGWDDTSPTEIEGIVPISIVQPGDIATIVKHAGATHVLVIQAGVLVPRLACEWLEFAARRTSASAALGDFDHLGPSPNSGRCNPAFHGAPSPLDRCGTGNLPPLALIESDQLCRALAAADAPSTLAAAMMRVVNAAARDLRLGHVPMVLCTDARSLGDRNVVNEASAPKANPVQGAGVRAQSVQDRLQGSWKEQAILVVIPTRDRVSDLARAISSAKRLAQAPHLVHIRVVDNQSAEVATLEYLNAQQAAGSITVVTHDAPFNWAKINNLAIEGDEGILLFANNDMEFQSWGWDDRVRSDLADPLVGVVGARLVYPDGRLQHAGILLGGNGLHPYHEGAGASRTAQECSSRFSTPRPAAAVTGAFMAMRRTTFETIGGFDENLAVAYNDIDMCLRVREVGLHVLFDPSIELTHEESMTRGHNDTAAKQAADAVEFEICHRLWADDFLTDPGVNPNWASVPMRPFRYLRYPDTSEIVAWIEGSVPSAWRTRKTSASR